MYVIKKCFDLFCLEVKEISLGTSVMAMAVDWSAMRALAATVDGRLQLWDLGREAKPRAPKRYEMKRHLSICI